MDRLSFVFSLLLIVSVTTTITFGYVIQAKNSNGESLEEPRSDPDLFPNVARKELGTFLKRSHHQSNPDVKTDAQAKLQGHYGLKEQEREMSKRVDPETLIPGTMTLESRDSQSQTVSIKISNSCEHTWENGKMYLKYGKKDNEPSPQVYPGTDLSLRISLEEAVGGVVTYDIILPDTTHSLVISFDVFEHINLWNLKFYTGPREASEALYDEMIVGSTLADSKWSDHTDLGNGLYYIVYMSEVPNAVLEIQIFSEPMTRI